MSFCFEYIIVRITLVLLSFIHSFLLLLLNNSAPNSKSLFPSRTHPCPFYILCFLNTYTLHSTVGNLVGGLVGTGGKTVGTIGRGVGDTVNKTTGTTAVGDGLKYVTDGVEDGTNTVGKGIEDVGKGNFK